MDNTPTCPHGIPLTQFCHELHLTNQPHRAADTQPACPHGIALDTFCRELHNRD